MADEPVNKDVDNEEAAAKNEAAGKEVVENTASDAADAPEAKQEEKAPAPAARRRTPVANSNSRGGKPQGGGNRGGRRKKREDRNSEESNSEYTDTLVPGGVFRCTAVVKGGRRLSFGALVVVGNGKGKVGVGYGKAKEVPMAIQKAIKDGHRNVKSFTLVGDGTIPHEVHGRYGAAHVVLVPAGPGTGIIAGSTVKTVLEMGGVHNVLTKSFGSNNRRNLVKATMVALESLRSHEQVEALRGVSLS